MATIQDISGAFTMSVDANSNAKVNLPTVLAQAGYAGVAGEAHDGASGLGALRRSVLATIEKRLAVGTDNILWDDFFSSAVINTRKYLSASTTMTAAAAAGLLTLNSGASTVTTVGYWLRSYKSFPLLGNFPLCADFWFGLALAPQANNNIEIGLALPNAAATSAPTDGVYLLIANAGASQLVSNYNGSLTNSAFTFAYTANRLYHGELVLHRDRAELFIDGALVAVVARPTAASVGALSQNQAGHLYARLANTAATTGAQKLLLSGWAVTCQDPAMNRPWGAARTGLGDNILSAPDSAAVANLENGANSAAPASATLSNTTAGYSTLGGKFQFAAVAGAETDYALFAYQVPAPAIGVPAKNLVITGLEIDTFNTGAASATTATLLEWAIGIGATAVSLATADSATGRAPARKSLGAQSIAIGAVIGARADRFISVDFSAAPLVVEAGTFFHVILRMPVGTATASQVIRGTVSPKGYFE